MYDDLRNGLVLAANQVKMMMKDLQLNKKSTQCTQQNMTGRIGFLQGFDC
jgi:hypothetical protein